MSVTIVRPGRDNEGNYWLDCGCSLTFSGYTCSLTRCPVHKAAPELLEACEDVLADFDDIQVTQASMNKMRRAVKKARELQAEIAKGK